MKDRKIIINLGYPQSDTNKIYVDFSIEAYEDNPIVPRDWSYAIMSLSDYVLKSNIPVEAKEIVLQEMLSTSVFSFITSISELTGKSTDELSDLVTKALKEATDEFLK